MCRKIQSHNPARRKGTIEELNTTEQLVHLEFEFAVSCCVMLYCALEWYRLSNITATVGVGGGPTRILQQTSHLWNVLKLSMGLHLHEAMPAFGNFRVPARPSRKAHLQQMASLETN